jgi:hypothetical protein
MSGFSQSHDAYFFEAPQVEDLLVAHNLRAPAAQFSVHGRGNVDRSQGFAENLAGELFQIRHEGSADFFLAFQNFGV